MNYSRQFSFRKLFSLLFLLLFVLAACGGNGDAPTTAPISQATEANVVVPTEAAPVSQATATGEAAVVESPTEVASTPAGDSPTLAPTDIPTIAVAMTKLNLNTATGDEFRAAIPGLGNNMVREFEEYRPYLSITQFRREIGKYVSDEQVAEYEKYVYVPINVNDSDAATVQQLPGVDETIAAALIAGRPYASNDDFLAKLATYVSADNLALAAAYLVAQ